MTAFAPVSLTNMLAALSNDRAYFLTNAQDVHVGMTVYAHATTSGSDDPAYWGEYVPHRVTRRWKTAIQLVALSDGTACSFAPYAPSTWDLRHDEVAVFVSVDDAVAAIEGTLPEPREGTEVNAHRWLTHEHGDRAIEAKDADRLRRYAWEADRTGATGVADHWRAMANIFDGSTEPTDDQPTTTTEESAMTENTTTMTDAQRTKLAADAARLTELAAALTAAAGSGDWQAVADAAREGEAVTCRTRRLAAKHV